MNSVIIDLSDFSGLDSEATFLQADVEYTLNPVTKALLINSKTATSSYLKYNIPGRLPVGTRVVFIAETRVVSDLRMVMEFDSYTSSDYQTNKAIETTKFGNNSDEFKEVRMSMLVKPDQQYIRVIFGYFSSRVGESEIRNPRLEINGVDIAMVKPQDVTPTNFDRYFSIEEINREWKEVESGTGSVVRNVNDIVFSADAASEAFIVYGALDTTSEKNKNAFWNVDLSKGFSVDIKGTRAAGMPAVQVKYLTSGNSNFRTMMGFFLAGDGEWATFYFPPVPTAEHAWVAIGLFSNSDGDFTLEGARLKQYGAPEQWGNNAFVPICATLQKIAGTWTILNDSVGDGAQRFASAVVSGISQNASAVTITFAANALKGMRPQIYADVSAEGDDARDYHSAAQNIINTQAVIRFYDHATNTTQDPTALPDGMIVQVMGMGIR